MYLLTLNKSQFLVKDLVTFSSSEYHFQFVLLALKVRFQIGLCSLHQNDSIVASQRNT